MDIREQTKADPSIIERTIFAFGLLEAITRVELPFIFKGGTSLLVMLDDPRRLSTDIDIVVAPGTDMDTYIEKAGTICDMNEAMTTEYIKNQEEADKNS